MSVPCLYFLALVTNDLPFPAPQQTISSTVFHCRSFPHLTVSYRFKRLLASLKLCLGILSPASSALSGAALAPYTTNPVPPPNPFVKRRADQPLQPPVPPAPSVPARRLVRPLLAARADATRAMWSFLADSRYLHGLVTARGRGEAWMQVGPATRHETP